MTKKTRLLPLIALCLTAAFALQAGALGVPAADEGPRLLASLPAQGELVGRDIAVILSFDRPVDKGSIKEACSFHPTVDFRVSGESECLIVPVNLLEGGTEYTFRLEPGRVTDLEGKTFARGLELTFSTRDDGMSIGVPALSFSGEIVEGSTPQGVAALTGFGIGHYPKTGRPGGGNLVLMAHSSGRIDFPFNTLSLVEAGDLFIVEYGGRKYVYSLRKGLVIRDNELWILDPTPSPLLTLFVCCAEDGRPSPTFHPPYRYVVRASLIETDPDFQGAGDSLLQFAR